MAVLQSTNVQGTLCVNGVAIGGGGKDFKFCCFTASDTWTPSSDLVTGDGVVDIVAIGGGGGGGTTSYGRQNCTQPRGFVGGQGAGGGVGQGLRIATSSNDACTITVGAGGTGGSITDAFSIFSLCSAVTAPTKGGDSSAMGIIGYGGGAGPNFSCSDGRYSTHCGECAGGPRGALGIITQACQYSRFYCAACEYNADQGGTCFAGTYDNNLYPYNYQNQNGCRNFNICNPCMILECFKPGSYFSRLGYVGACDSTRNSGSNQASNDPTAVDNQYFGMKIRYGAYGYCDGQGKYMGVGGQSPFAPFLIPGQSQYGNYETPVSASGFGNGGAGTCRLRCGGCTADAPAMDGTDGIVILKWHE